MPSRSGSISRENSCQIDIHNPNFDVNRENAEASEILFSSKSEEKSDDEL